MYYFSIFIFLSFFFGFSEILFSDFSRKNQFSETLKKYKQKTKEKFLDPIELDIYKIKKELEIWENLEKKIQSFIEILKKFDHPVHSPFDKKIILADSPHFKAKVIGKTSLEGKRKFKILQLAQSDKIRSNAFSLDQKLKPSIFYIHIADKKFKIDFPGGSLYDLYSYMQLKQSQKYYYCYFLPLSTQENKNILILEGVLPGIKNKISLSGDLNFLKEIGFLISSPLKKQALKAQNQEDKKKPEENLIELKEETKEISFTNEKNLNAKTLSSIQIKKNTSARSENIGFDSTSRKINYIEFFYKDLEKKEKKSEPKVPDSDSIGDSQVFEVADLDFETTPLRKYFDEYEKNNKKDPDEKKLKDEKFLFLNFLSKQKEKLLKEDLKISLSSSTDWKKINFDIPQSLNLNISDIHSLILNNKNEKEIDLKELSISFLKENKSKKESLSEEETSEDPDVNSKESGLYNFIHKAHDSKISLDGLILKRDSNIISDIFPGVQIELNSKTMSEQEFLVKKDFNSIVDLIKNMIHKYNTLFIFLSNISDPFYDKEEFEKSFLVKSDLKKWKEKEKEFQKHSEENKEFLIYTGEAYRGYMDYEFMISHLKNKLHTLMLSSPFKITEDKKIRFLSQIGIRTESFLTNSENLYSDIQSKKGLLHVSEEILSKYLENFFYEIKAFFSYKNTKVSDLKEGFCIQMILFLNPYIKSKKENKQFRESLIGSKKRIIKQKLRQKRLFFLKKETQVDKRTRKFEKDIKKANEYQNYYENKKDYYRQTFGAGQK